MNIRERRPRDFEAVRRLLEEADLPFNGIERTRGWVDQRQLKFPAGDHYFSLSEVN